MCIRFCPRESQIRLRLAVKHGGFTASSPLEKDSLDIWLERIADEYTPASIRSSMTVCGRMHLSGSVVAALFG